GATFTIGANGASLTRLENKQSNQSLSVSTGKFFSMTLSDNTVVDDANLTLTVGPALENLAADSSAVSDGEKYAGKAVTATWQAVSGTTVFNIDWAVELRADANTFEQSFQITPVSGPLTYTSLQLLKLDGIPSAAKYGRDDGSPLVGGGASGSETFFFGIENPMSKPSASGTTITSYVPSAATAAVGEQRIETVGIGVTIPGQLRRSFNYYVERERAHSRRTFLHWQSWWDMSSTALTSQGITDAINTFGTELTNRGAKIDSFFIDDGWDYVRSPQVDETNLQVWDFDPTRFPNGFAPQLPLLAQFPGTSMSVWMSPFGGYGSTQAARLALNATKDASVRLETKSTGFTLSGEKYYAAFRNRVLDMMDNQGVQGFKFDGVGGGNNAQGADSNYIADYEYLFKLLKEIRSLRSDVFVNETVGTWGSPYWLWYVDSIWRNGSDSGQSGSGTTVQKWVTYRDQQSMANRTTPNPLFPTTALMNHGYIWPNADSFWSYSSDLSNATTRAEAASQAKSFFALGLTLQELYIEHASVATTVSGANLFWDDLAMNAKWARDNQDLLADTRYIGDTTANSVYGTAAYRLTDGGGEGMLMLRNPTAATQKFTVDPQALFEIPEGYATKLKFAERDAAADTFVSDTGDDAYIVTLDPYEVLVFEAEPTTDPVTENPAEPESDGTNLALTGTATAKSSWDAMKYMGATMDPATKWPQYVPANAIDGNPATKWGSRDKTANVTWGYDTTASTYNPDEDWFQVELADPAYVNKVVVQWAGSCSTNYEIQVSETGLDGSWTTVATSANACETVTHTFDALPDAVKFVRMQSHASSDQWGLVINEFEIYGKQKSPTFAQLYDLVAITSESNTAPGNADAEGHSYSAEKLADFGLNPGEPFTCNLQPAVDGTTFSTCDGLSFIWPDKVGEPNAVIANGQTVPVSGNVRKIGFLGFGIGNNTALFTNQTVTVKFTDGTSQVGTISFSLWSKPQTTAPAANEVAWSIGRNRQPPDNYGDATHRYRVYYAAVTVPAEKTVESVILPTADMMRFFSMALSADLAELVAAIAGADALDEADYTPASWAPLASALAAAKSARDAVSPPASQAAVDAAAAALRDAIDGLQAGGGTPAQPELLLDVSFDTAGPVDAKGHTFTVLDSPAAQETVFSDLLGAYVGKSDPSGGKGGWVTTLTSAERTSMESGFTAEVYLNVDSIPSGSYTNAWGSQQSGGFGFEFYPVGSSNCTDTSKPCVQAWFPTTTDGGATSSQMTPKLQAALEYGQWVDLVFAWDGLNAKLYVNGVVVDSGTKSGAYHWPTTSSQCDDKWMINADCGGGPASSNTFYGQIAAGSLYSGALEATAVADLYEARKPAAATAASLAALSALVSAVEALGDVSDVFTAASVQALSDALAAGKAVLAKDPAVVTQAEVDSAVAGLNAALAGLTPDTSALEAAQ
ncbi:MAG: discoidin domain-containing protein, partial [Propionibacteriaceae bacterium]|nr:discoidin domain-containing protein [Propionibacteriaceae bacterium]